MLSQKILKEVLSYNPSTGVFTRRKNGDVAGTVMKLGYRRVRVKGGLYLAHRLAWLYVYGCWPENEIDHINRDKDDNRIANLRDVTRQTNCLNQPIRKINTSGCIGVDFHKASGKWQARIRLYGTTYHGGFYHKKEDAVVAREKLERTHAGDIG